MTKFSIMRDSDAEEEEEENDHRRRSTKTHRCSSSSSPGNSPKRKKQRTTSVVADDARKKIEDGISVTEIDPEVLECNICMEPLVSPVFQCENGHIACSLCCVKLGNKCPSCSWPIGYSRCLAIEKVIESIRVSCQYAQHGCRKTFNYAEKYNHEEMCIHSPCMCPIHDCTFTGSSEQLSLHFSDKHWSSARRFRYNSPFMVSLKQDDTFLVFQEEGDDLFLLNNRIELIGNVLTVTCFKRVSSSTDFPYDIVTRRGGSTLRLHSFTNFVKQRTEASLTDFLLVPYDFNHILGKLKLEICIWNSEGSE